MTAHPRRPGTLFTNDLAIDLGTANTRVFVRGRGVVFDEPSVVAIDLAEDALLAVGHTARAMLGRTPPAVAAIRPLEDGVITDLGVAERMLRHVILRTQRRLELVRPHIVLGVPSGITRVEKRAVRDSARQAGAREVHLIETPVAAVVGAGLSVEQPSGHLIVDIGGGTTEVAVIALSGIVSGKSIRVAGDEIDEAIVQHVKKQYNLLIGAGQAEAVKIWLGSACRLAGEERTAEAKGRDLTDGLPKRIVIGAEEVREALREPVTTIADAVLACLEETPPELAADIVDTGIVLAGGGALLRGMDLVLGEKTGLPVVLAADPLACVVRGLARLLEDPALREKVGLAD